MFIPYKKLFLLTIMALSALPVNAAQAEKIILAFGDSLMSGYGIPLEKSFPAQLEQKLREEGHAVKVVNAGVTGDTSSGGLTRLEWTLEQQHPDFVILELGANDMLRGIDPKVTRENLQKIMDTLKTKKIPVLLAGMQAAPNLGIFYTDSYQKMYKSLAKEYGALYYPFFLDGVAMEQTLNQPDGMHPNEQGVAVIVEKILPFVEDLLEEE